MLRTEADHPVNQTRNEILGQVSGGFALREEYCTCHECDKKLDHGDSIVVFYPLRNASINHRWERVAMFCTKCKPINLDADVLEDLPRRSNEALICGTLRDKGYWGTFGDGEGGTEKRWTYQDGHWADFAATRIVDLSTDESFSPIVTKTGGRQFHYNPASDGKTVPVPASVLRELIENTNLVDDAPTYAGANEDPLRWAKALLKYHHEWRR